MQAVCGLAIVYLLRVFSRHLGFAKRGELGRVKEGGVGVGEGLESKMATYKHQEANYLQDHSLSLHPCRY